MNTNLKKLLSILLSVVLMICAIPAAAMTAIAEDVEAAVEALTTENVAKVGNTEYATIDEAIAAWTNGTTLTLLADVTLSDVINLSSTEYHVLDLGTYTMTAASKKDAIQIVNNARSSASYTLDIKADSTNPGGITATGKAVVRTTGKSGVKDRPIIRFYNGIFNASYIVYHSGSNGTNCPQFQFHGGEFNGTVYTNRALNTFYGGTFTGSLMMSVDSSAYTLIAGGTFKKLSNQYMSALNSSKFTIGSAKGVYDKEVYVDDNGNFVIAKAEPSQGIEAAVAKTPGTNDYLAYSKVATEGALNYTDVYTALEKNKTATVTVYADEVDLTNSSFKGTIVLPENSTVEIKNAPADLKVTNTAGKVLTPNANGEYTTVLPPVDVEGIDVVVTDKGNDSYDVTLGDGATWNEGTSVTMTFPAVDGAVENDSAYVVHEHEDGRYIYIGKVDENGKVVVTNNIGFSTFTVNAGGLTDAIAAAQAGDTIILLEDISLDAGITVPADKTITLDLNGKTISQTKAQTAGYQMILNDGNLTIKDSGNGGKISYTDSGNGGEYISDTIYNRGTLVINGGTIENLSSATVASNGYPHAVDTYSGIRDTSVTVNGGTIYCAEYSAIRMFCVSATYKADLVINGGTIKGAIDMQNGTKNKALGSLTINGGTFETTKNANNIRFANWNGGATEYGITASVKGGSFNGGITTQYVPAAANWNSKIISGGTFTTTTTDLSAFVVDGKKFSENGTVVTDPAFGKVAKVGEVYFTDIQEAIKAAAPAGTVDVLSNITVDKWIMFSEKLNISTGQIITLKIDGLTINGNGHTLTIKSIESASNGGYLFYDATNLNINNLIITYESGLVGGIGLASGTISNVTFNGGQYGVLPGNGGVNITGCTFNGTKGYAVYYEDARDGIVVSDNEFNTASGAYAITMRDNEQFTGNTIITGRVNVANSAKSTISNNDFGTERFKVYNEATATIADNKINNLVFSDTTATKATFTTNTLSETAEAALDAVVPVVMIGTTGYTSLAEAVKAVPAGAGETTITLLADQSISGQFIGHSYAQKIILDLNNKTLSSKDKALTCYRSGTVLTIKNGTVSGNSTGGTIQVTYGGKLILGEGAVIQAGGQATVIKVDNGSVELAAGADGKVKLSGGKNKIVAATDDSVKFEACVNDYAYSTFTDAIAAANDGDTIKLVKNFTVGNNDTVNIADNDARKVMFRFDKNATLDLNGKTITVNYDSEDLLYAVVFVADGATLTVNNSKDSGGIKVNTGTTRAKVGNNEYDCVCYVFWNNGNTGGLVINGGKYYANTLEDSMVYTNISEKVIINGGSFELGAIGTRENGHPWIFNAQGRNERNIVVNGGSFNADVFHQYWIFEVDHPYNKALKYNNGMYTVVDAVAYIEESYYSGKMYTKKVGYASLQDAFDACSDPDTKIYYRNIPEILKVVLLTNIKLTAPVEVSKTNIILDIGNYNITMEASTPVSMITNKKELTIKGNGKISFTYTGTPANNVAANTISNRGKLTIYDVEISNTGNGNQIGYAIDNYNGATLVVEGGKITASGSSYYDGIRLFCGNTETMVTVKSGTISSIWAQNPSANKATPVKGTVVIDGGTVNVIYYENYTTVKVLEGVNANVTAYGAGSNNTTTTNADGYTVYSFAK